MKSDLRSVKLCMYLIDSRFSEIELTSEREFSARDISSHDSDSVLVPAMSECKSLQVPIKSLSPSLSLHTHNLNGKVLVRYIVLTLK
jgi:hypothetical protein